MSNISEQRGAQISDDIGFIESALSNPDFAGCTLEYYPTITKLYENGGKITVPKNVFMNIYNVLSKQFVNMSHHQTVEYTHRNMKLILSENGKEYLQCAQVGYFIGTGLVIVNKENRIDPNKFPIIGEYNDVSKRDYSVFHLKNVKIQTICENNSQYPIKIITECNPDNKNHVVENMKNIRELIYVIQ